MQAVPIWTAAMGQILCSSTATLCELFDGVPVILRTRFFYAHPQSHIDKHYLRSLNVHVYSDEDLQCLCSAAPNLSQLTLRYTCCSNVGLGAIGQHCHNLRELSFPHSGERIMLMDEGITAIAIGCPQLTVLYFKYRKNLTDKGFIALATHCAHLSRLEVLHNDNITDAALTALAHSSSAGASLTTLTLDYCTAIKGPGIAAIASCCTNLQILRLEGLNAVHLTPQTFPIMPSIRDLKLALIKLVDEMLHLMSTYTSAGEIIH